MSASHSCRTEAHLHAEYLAMLAKNYEVQEEINAKDASTQLAKEEVKQVKAETAMLEAKLEMAKVMAEHREVLSKQIMAETPRTRAEIEQLAADYEAVLAWFEQERAALGLQVK
ncbi:unnamed protein product [Tilletia controversa]|nr:hypothetical protein CF336_g2985 [Tilletia laevis]KAE8263034.1 hypothetical protein A4X03_0g1982 [Tilletia caries]CAD6901084.1 unnamed protein product [Tilletia controversa]KAE8206629.1 hypothetical protein CF335_g1737 [Tilletia laevis]CAD6891702.1 unnamed protein product [Tilletia caries]